MTTDLFKQARECLTIPDAWEMLGLQGEPKTSCKSPLRDERTASFTIYDNGTKWKDHGEQIGGDVVEFIKHAIGGDYSAVRDWLVTRLGSQQPIAKAISPPKSIQYPAKTTEGTARHWKVLANSRGLDLVTARFMASFGLVKFMQLDGVNCYVVTDATARNAEIRRIDKKPFGNAKKSYPLTGVDKSWLVGAEILADSPEAHVLLVEGATDFLSAWDLNVLYRSQLGRTSAKWVPVALLGAGCKALHPDCAALLAGRQVRIVPDGDTAGDQMRDHWQKLLIDIGCTVDVVELQRGQDLTDIKTLIQPEEFFAL